MIRTNSIPRREDGLCASGCGQPALPDRAFCSETCRKRQLRRSWKKRGNQITMSGYSPHRKAVKCLDPQCSREYYISKAEWKSNADAYQKLGIEVVVNGQQTLC